MLASTTAILDYRKSTVELVLAPYLVDIRRLSSDDAYMKSKIEL